MGVGVAIVSLILLLLSYIFAHGYLSRCYLIYESRELSESSPLLVCVACLHGYLVLKTLRLLQGQGRCDGQVLVWYSECPFSIGIAFDVQPKEAYHLQIDMLVVMFSEHQGELQDNAKGKAKYELN